MNPYFLIVFLADSIRLKSDLDIDTTMSRNGTIWRDITKGRARIGITDSCTYFLKYKIDLKITNVLYLHGFFNELI